MRDVRGDFPLLERRLQDRPLIYLDSAATSLKPRCVIDAVTGFYLHHTSNVHRATHPLASEATDRFEGVRRRLARFLRADENEIVFTRGITDAIHLLRHGRPDLRRTACSVAEHHSNLLPWAHHDHGRLLGCDGEGRVDLEDLDRALEEGLDLVAVSHVGNALGTVQPVEEIIRRAHAAGARVLVDAAQSASHMPLDVRALDCDFLVLGAHKMLGPSGVGALYGKSAELEKMRPVQLGGSMVDQVHREGYELLELPHRLEAGTPPIEAVLGWGAALEYLDELGREEIHRHSRSLVQYALERLGQQPKLRLLGPGDAGHRGALVSFQVPGLEAHGVARMLGNRENIMVRSGFQCAQPLHEALGLLPTVRASFHVYNQHEEVDRLAECLEAVVQFL